MISSFSNACSHHVTCAFFVDFAIFKNALIVRVLLSWPAVLGREHGRCFGKCQFCKSLCLLHWVRASSPGGLASVLAMAPASRHRASVRRLLTLGAVVAAVASGLGVTFVARFVGDVGAILTAPYRFARLATITKVAYHRNDRHNI
ncbi:hypothetical protein AK812_SmicGene38060 [Symbiodinium microadriaticum]|uniref:Uncharacterized protein n=1 Tax=Symbiodinium microadriaticum TaxID=2951 RepID=A0A1Q9CEM7_SYMMI|nr:hypothetical protein AK812_SmicGene38060 [Symbiodinium microadriaticum]